MSQTPRTNPGEHLRLQQFDLGNSAYERPNQKWVCGHLCEGSPCALGPDDKGRCLATAECRPAKKGDRWVCTRRDATTAPCPCEGGPQSDGTCGRPIARCSPVRSMRAKRSQFVFAVFALSIGVLGFFLLGPRRSQFAAPGQLTEAHAQVLKAHRAGDCSACHAAGSGDASQWVRLAIAPARGATQNQKCLACHGAALGRDAAHVHSLAPGVLRAITDASPVNPPRTRWQILASWAPAPQTTPRGELACAACHHEHLGRFADLTAMSDLSCQVCHKNQFASFAMGHPEFKAVRHDRAGIKFDHAKHESRMPGGKLDCALCHRPDPVGRTMQFTSFQQACVGCHDQGQLDHHGEQIRDDVRMVLQLPSMKLDNGNWPSDALAPGSALAPLLQLLVAGDDNPAAVQALKSLAASPEARGSPGDDWDAEPATKAALAAAIKQVTKELALDDDAPPKPPNRDLLQARIARAAGVPKNNAAVIELLDQLAAATDQAKSWQQHVLPRLAEDLAGTLKPTTAPAANEPAAANEWKLPKESSGWFVDPTAVSVSHRTSHADSFDRITIDLLASGMKSVTWPPIDPKMSDQAFRAALLPRLLVQIGGTCLKCHAVQPLDGALYVNWHVAGHATRVAGYVKFDHRPHLTLFAGADQCSRCHRLESTPPPAQGQSSPIALLALAPSANHGMAAHDKAACAACHMPTGAPDNCLACHLYHMTR